MLIIIILTYKNSKIIGNNTITETFNSKIYIMDISTYTWVDTFEVKNTPSTPTSPTSPSQTSADSGNSSTKDNNTLKIVIGVLSGIIFLGIIGIVAHILRK